MTREEIYWFLRRYRYGVIGSVSRDGSPQAAIVGYAATESLEIVFDTLRSSRKFANLTGEPRCSFVVGGWDGEQTIQFEGVARELQGAELEPRRKVYFLVFPDGRERAELPEIAYVALRPRWIRFSDYYASPPMIQEWWF